MPQEMNTEQILIAMILELKRNHGAWLTFRQLARRVRGDMEDAYLLASVALSRPDLFLVSRDQQRVALRTEVIQAAAETATHRLTGQAIHLAAANAVREYARQLRPLRIPVVRVGSGQLVLDRYVHDLQVDITDDDLKLPDDTPVELVYRFIESYLCDL